MQALDSHTRTGQDGFASARESIPGLSSDDFWIHSRDVYVPLSFERRAGVFHGISSEENSGFLQPTAKRRGGFLHF